MANKKPIVRTGGDLEELQSGDKLDASIIGSYKNQSTPTTPPPVGEVMTYAKNDKMHQLDSNNVEKDLTQTSPGSNPTTYEQIRKIQLLP